MSSARWMRYDTMAKVKVLAKKASRLLMFDCGAYPLGGDYATSDRVCKITSDCARRLVASQAFDFATFDVFLEDIIL